MGERKHPVRVIRSGLTGTIYALTNYRERENGLIEVRGLGKHDVTADVEAIVAERLAALERENARLRKALGWIAETETGSAWGNRAREALEGGGHGA